MAQIGGARVVRPPVARVWLQRLERFEGEVHRAVYRLAATHTEALRGRVAEGEQRGERHRAEESFAWRHGGQRSKAEVKSDAVGTGGRLDGKLELPPAAHVESQSFDLVHAV